VVDTERFLAEVRALVRRLSPQIVAEWRSTEKRPRTKSDGSFVTETDHFVERELIECMQRVAPGVAVVAEEEVSGRIHASTQTASDYYNAVLQDEHLVVIDPIDGTKNFVEGRPHFCIAVGLTARKASGHWPIAGVVGVPAQGLMFWSDGTQVVREALSSGAVESINRQSGASATIFANSHEQRWLENKQKKLRGERHSYSASVYDILVTALGENFAALLGSQRVWDIVAPLAIALPLGLSARDAETGEQIGSLCAADFSQDIDRRAWRLNRKIVLLPHANSLADALVNCGS
jgi:fructose-1,6-bisphosphatase/inositol monophosphatase family enzyme